MEDAIEYGYNAHDFNEVIVTEGYTINEMHEMVYDDVDVHLEPAKKILIIQNDLRTYSRKWYQIANKLRKQQINFSYINHIKVLQREYSACLT